MVACYPGASGAAAPVREEQTSSVSHLSLDAGLAGRSGQQGDRAAQLLNNRVIGQ